MYPELYKCNSRESTFVEFYVDGNNFIDSLDLGRDSNPDPGTEAEWVYHYAIDLLNAICVPQYVFLQRP